jgi:hypothetical protein
MGMGALLPALFLRQNHQELQQNAHQDTRPGQGSGFSFNMLQGHYLWIAE